MTGEDLEKMPPLGLVPRFVRDSERGCEILDAMGRYVAKGWRIPEDWLLELREINSRLRRMDYMDTRDNRDGVA